jgi:hypothetical protein
MKNILRCVPLLLVLCAGLGCTVDLKTAVLGRYRGQADISGVDGQHREIAERAAMMVNGWMLEVKPNGKATLSGLGHSGRGGTWRLENGRLILTPEGSDRGLEFEIRDGAKKLVPVLGELESKFLQGASVWFKKV